MNMRFLIVMPVLLAFLGALACGKKEERLFQEALAEADAGRASQSALAAALIGLATAGRFGVEAAVMGGAVAVRGGETLRVKWPRDITVRPGKGFVEGVFNPNSGGSAFTDGKALALFGPDGGRLESVKAPGEGKVTGLFVDLEEVYFLQGGFLYGLQQGKGPAKAIEGAVITPPKLSITLRTGMEKSGNFLAVNCGHAGVYSLSVVDLPSRKTVLKDFSNASLSFGLYEGKLACITGATGRWALVEYNLLAGTKSTVRSFTSLRDVSFAGGYAALMDDAGVIVANVGEKKFLRAPSEIGLAGSAGGHFLLSWKKEKRLVDPKIFFDGLERISGAAPSLFNP